MFYYLSPRSGENFDLFMSKNGSECRKKHVLVIFHEKIGEKNLCATHKRPKIFLCFAGKIYGNHKIAVSIAAISSSIDAGRCHCTRAFCLMQIIKLYFVFSHI